MDPQDVAREVATPAPTSVRVGRKASLVLLSQLVGVVVGAGIVLVIGRYIEPGALGVFTFALAALGFTIAILGNFGLGEAHVYHLARGLDPRTALGVYVRLRLGVMAILVLVALGAAATWFLALGKPITDATTVPILAIVLVMQVASSVRQVAFDTWLGREKVNRTELAKGLDSVLTLLFITMLGLAIAGSLGRWTPVPALSEGLAGLFGMREATWGVAQVGFALACAYFLAKALSLVPVTWWWLRDKTRVGSWDRSLARDYLAYASPIALAGAMVAVQGSTDIVMLGYFYAEHEVGLYAQAQRVASAALIAGIAVGTPLLPRFSLLLEAGRREEARRLLRQAERYLLLASTPVGVALAVLAVPVLHVLVGDKYLDSAPALRLLGLWVLVVAATGPARTKLMAAGATRATMVTSLISVVLNILLNLAFIPRFALGLGIMGAALATLLSTCAATVYLRWQVRKRFGEPLLDSVLLRMAAAGFGLALFWAGALAWLGPGAFSRFWLLALWGLAGVAVFAGLAALLGMLDRADWSAVRRVASPRGLWRELRGRT